MGWRHANAGTISFIRVPRRALLFCNLRARGPSRDVGLGWGQRSPNGKQQAGVGTPAKADAVFPLIHYAVSLGPEREHPSNQPSNALVKNGSLQSLCTLASDTIW
ncbi:hypothetical protein CDO27_19700 (plasmid) [Sinorhizobium meliloti]|nr:hypothetical protein CDO27_19700 [Sinorhizobium meliloti]CCM70152.1 hypothetical protein BN406_03870 [Sinorhizobium meliloti Rm41]